ncbi:cell division protein FtsK [Streptococcus anginosus]|uniref:cell division protein FtsK n=1 Tax=Streptococcus anginosus TaxID=1328 RepID=UPI0022E114F7|nr:cell division protein FtsK [Streptococcus anginosus]
MKRKYRRITKKLGSKHQAYYYSAICFCLLLVVCIVIEIINLLPFEVVQKILYLPRVILHISSISMLFTFMYCWSLQEKVSVISIPTMSSKSKKTARKLKRLFNDKQITDVLKLSNSTRYGEEMPEIHVWIDDSLSEGFIAIENIANWECADRENFEQRVSGILSGKYQRFAVVNSKLTTADSYILFYYEDTLTSQRLLIKSKESLHELIHENKHAIRLSKDLVWHSDIVPHLSVIARTRAGKSVLAGRYMARLMLLQGWVVEYNSAKYDRYVKEFDGQSDSIKIVERAEYWCTVMDERLAKINEADKEKYLEMEHMPNIGLFFDELGNLNASLESLDKTDKSLKITSRWYTAINRLSATGGSAGIHIIAISQFATKEGFLPSLARVNCSDAVIMLGGAADSAEERKYLMSGFADMPKRSYGKGQGIARIISSGKKWEVPHFYETPWFDE